MVTHEWIDEEGTLHPIKETIIIEPHETIWMEVLDRILDEMSKHYGYSIKDQVYYAVEFPLNEVDEHTGKPFAGYGRSLNDKVLQQLLLSFPEVYEVDFKEKFTLA
jgi:glycine cleavage system protein P-like pyridoxal-binding family